MPSLCPFPTFLQDSDLETAWVQLSLDSMSLRWTPKQQWYYKELKRGEGYRFITSPHEGPEGAHRERDGWLKHNTMRNGVFKLDAYRSCRSAR